MSKNLSDIEEDLKKDRPMLKYTDECPNDYFISSIASALTTGDIYKYSRDSIVKTILINTILLLLLVVIAPQNLNERIIYGIIWLIFAIGINIARLIYDEKTNGLTAKRRKKGVSPKDITISNIYVFEIHNAETTKYAQDIYDMQIEAIEDLIANHKRWKLNISIEDLQLFDREHFKRPDADNIASYTIIEYKINGKSFRDTISSVMIAGAPLLKYPKRKD